MWDSHKNFRKCSTNEYLTSVKESSHSHHLNECYGYFCFSGYNIEIYRKMLPTSDKSPITFFLGKVSTPNFHRMCETKLN